MKHLQRALLVLAVLFYVLHFPHLQADFPNHSPWMDWAKYTDEGWYGDAAIRYYLHGDWHLTGDFNPGAALPVWPLLEAGVFHFTGVGVVPARALAVTVLGGILTCGYLLGCLPVLGGVRQRWLHLYAAAGVALLACSPFVYAFGRMAVLEPLLVLLTLCALLVAYAIRQNSSLLHRAPRLMAVGLLVALMIGTKTTAVFLVPAVVWMLCSSSGWKPSQWVRDCAIAGATALVPVAVYLFLLRRNGFAPDVRYLFAANNYTGITRDTFWATLAETLRHGLWIGPVLYVCGLLVGAVALLRRAHWADPVLVSLALWAGGYLGYIAYHANFQPRYYFVVAVPLALLVARGAVYMTGWSPLTHYAFAALLLYLVTVNVQEMSRFILHPEYTFERAAAQIGGVVRAEPAHSQTVLSISGSNLSLMTGLPSICDDFGTMQLDERIAAYKPGWFVTWNVIEDDKMEALSRFYRLTRMASMPALDDPDRNLLILYRLDAREGGRPGRHLHMAKPPGTVATHGSV